MKLTRLSILLFLISFPVFSQYPNFRIFPSGISQIEPSIFTSPVNPQVMFVSAFTISGTGVISESIYLTSNGGANWTGTDQFPGTPSPTHAGDPGPIIDKNGILILTHQGSVQSGMYANYSTNMGGSWSNSSQIATQDQDKGSPNTDEIPSSPYYGRTYLVWTRYTTPFPIVISYTTNSGVSWSAFSAVNNSIAGHQSQGANIVIGPNGEVYVAWSASVTSSPFYEDKIGFASSTNGGVNWLVNEQAYDCNGIKATQLAPWNIRVNGYPLMDVDKTGGPRNGWIYIVTGEKNLAPAGSDPDIIFHRSSDGGTTWSQGIRVNQDAINNGRVQYFPEIVVEPSGAIDVVYNDGRNNANSIEVYLSRSTNGGDNWSDYKISDHSFIPGSVSGAGSGNQGDNIGITYANGKIWPVWMDNSSGIYQAWTAGIDVNTIGIQTISTEVPSSFSLMQNYPNPFNPETKIRFTVPAGMQNSNVKITIYDLLGKELSVPVDQKLQPGTYETTWNASDYPSGTYFYKIKTNNFSETKKMVLVK